MISDLKTDDIPLQINIFKKYGSPHSNALLHLLKYHKKSLFGLKSESCKQHKATCHPTNCDMVNDVKLFTSVNYSISKYIRI